MSYSLALCDAENKHIPIALDQQMGLMCHSPLGSGAVAGNIQRDKPQVAYTRMAKMPELMASPRHVILDIADAIAQVADETGKTYAQISLKLVLSRPGVYTEAAARQPGCAGLEANAAARRVVGARA